MNPGQNNNPQFVRNDDDKQKGVRFTLISAFRCAGAGLITTLKRQRNARIHLAFAVAAVVLGLALRIDFLGWLAIIISIALVIGVECINTAVETIVDLVSPGYHELAKKAKDSAAAAVLVVSLSSLVVAAFVYGKAILDLIAGA
ncbi:MAG: diacylglycerol kinase family protein [Eggerthellaceae bacterium]|nr:diacylglycerol kinase family protein [Eggerthellaceae bacterium]MDR2721554.1 diacylglycerol kinase family protein [Coriobacteriaceae bacterium]